jgi:NADPH:quinone reductase-like Zn-dependent oxidoreductase
MRAAQITRFGGPGVLDIVDVPEPIPGQRQTLFDVSTAGVNLADTHHRSSLEVDRVALRVVARRHRRNGPRGQALSVVLKAGHAPST